MKHSVHWLAAAANSLRQGEVHYLFPSSFFHDVSSCAAWGTQWLPILLYHAWPFRLLIFYHKTVPPSTQIWLFFGLQNDQAKPGEKNAPAVGQNGINQ